MKDFSGVKAGDVLVANSDGCDIPVVGITPKGFPILDRGAGEWVASNPSLYSLKPKTRKVFVVVFRGDDGEIVVWKARPGDCYLEHAKKHEVIFCKEFEEPEP